MREDFIEFKKYYIEAASQLVKDSFFMESINHKFQHSICVLQYGRRILYQTPELKSQSDDFKNMAQKALLFHDVGRFEEAVMRYHTPDLEKNPTVLNRYDHGLIGYEKLKNNPLYNDIRILLAIFYHGKMMDQVKKSSLWEEAQKSPYAQDCEKILYLVRDADKMALLKDIKEKDRLRKDIFFKLLSKEALEAGLSQEVKEQFFACRPVLSQSVTSFADRILFVLAWIFDLNYVRTKEIFKENGYAEHLLKMMSEYHVSDKEIDDIRKFIYQNL